MSGEEKEEAEERQRKEDEFRLNTNDVGWIYPIEQEEKEGIQEIQESPESSPSPDVLEEIDGGREGTQFKPQGAGDPLLPPNVNMWNLGDSLLDRTVRAETPPQERMWCDLALEQQKLNRNKWPEEGP